MYGIESFPVLFDVSREFFCLGVWEELRRETGVAKGQVGNEDRGGELGEGKK